MTENEIQTKIHENRLRRAAKRQGLRLEKIRRRDPRAIDYNRWRLLRPSGARVFGGRNGATLEEVEEVLRGGE